ncbi:MAG: hypothetical protein JEZ05_03395, partial [Tenericutes bacterium]|nr:hypothetical protein [Mycoplasmatota bacterium]
MKKLIYGNIILIVLFIISFILSFFVVDSLTKLTLLMPIIILFMEAGMFLYTFTGLKKSTLRTIRRVLGVYSIIVVSFTIFIKVYTFITGYYFINTNQNTLSSILDKWGMNGNFFKY